MRSWKISPVRQKISAAWTRGLKFTYLIRKNEQWQMHHFSWATDVMRTKTDLCNVMCASTVKDYRLWRLFQFWKIVISAFDACLFLLFYGVYMIEYNFYMFQYKQSWTVGLKRLRYSKNGVLKYFSVDVLDKLFIRINDIYNCYDLVPFSNQTTHYWIKLHITM